jgi:hypothetical protein
MAMLRTARHGLVSIAVGAALIAAGGWAVGALWFDGPQARPLAALLATGFAAGALLLVWRAGALGFLALFAPVLAWWLALAPSNDRPWQADVARLPSARFDGSRVTIQNVRDFDYRSENDYTAHWEQRTYDLAELTGADFYVSQWGSPWIAHTIVSWTFADAPPLAISIETRKEIGETYSALRGFFRQYEIYYVVADERDVIRLRTNFRGEQVHLYHLQMPRDAARRVLVDYLAEVNRLAVEPRWYNALTHNCTTTIRQHQQSVIGRTRLDWRMLLNGRIDEMAYARGSLDRRVPFPALRRASDIGERARSASREDFSARIRARE